MRCREKLAMQTLHTGATMGAMKKQGPRLNMTVMLIPSLFVSLLFIAYASSAADTVVNRGWSYAIEKGIEKSKRSYLLLYHPGTKEEKKVSVVSRCSKPQHSEGVYGTCTHAITIHPGGHTFSLKTGEDVVLADSSFDFPVLGTVEYGCCAGSDRVSFYTEKGEYLGRITTINLTKGNNAITDVLDVRNSTGRNDSTKYFVVQDDKNDLAYFAWTSETKRKMRKLPIIYEIFDKGACDEWYLSKFSKYADRTDITFALEGRFCEKQSRLFSCQKEESRISCTLRQ